jgi:acyl-CoA synthetase (AMP-forming)/AMP-acid ligase II
MNNFMKDPSAYRSIPDILRSSTDRFGDRPALICGDRLWTYAEIGRQVDAGRRYLEERGVTPGSRIAIVGENDPYYVIGYFAAQELACSTVEIGRHESLKTLMITMTNAGARLVLSDREDLVAALAGSVQAASFRDFAQGVEEESRQSPASDPVACADGDREASIIYTSGTTGLPKGVILSQTNFCHIVTAIQDYLQLISEDRYGLVLPLSHSYGKSNLLTTFAAGASLVMLEAFHDLPGFLGSLASQRCTFLSAVPYHANMLLRWGNLSSYDLTALKVITFSGNHLPADTVKALQTALPGIRIFSMYGLTESTTRACYLPAELALAKPGSCGRPLRGMDIRIVAEDGVSQPAGYVGEVWLRGPNIMQGYLGEPELTAQTLADGWLRTGDLGRLDEEGFLYLEGRLKDIIKCAGERISPAEIEQVLSCHASVVEAAVVGIPDAVLGEAVLAYIVPRGEFRDESSLRMHCAKQLSHHKLPRKYRFVDKLPRTATGKIQASVLRNEDPYK